QLRGGPGAVRRLSLCAQEPRHPMRPVYRGYRVRAGALRGVQPDGSGRRRGRPMDCRPSQSQEPTGEAMNRSFLFVPLLLATGVALADDAPQAKGAGPATEAQEKTDP